MRVFQIVKKVIGGASAGFIASVVQTGVSLTNRFALAPEQVSAGVSTSPTQPVLLVDEKPAVATSLLGVTGSASVQTAAGVSTGPRISEYHLDALPAAEIVRVVYDLTRRVGGNAQAAVGTAWTNPANSISGTNGIHDGSNATCAGSALGNTNGIELNYANSANKGDLTITSATLHVYGAGVDATGLLLSTVISYNIGAGLTTLETIAGGWSNPVTPRSYSLPLLNTWAEYDALAARVVCTFAAASLLSNASLDAIEIEIVAARTDAL